MRADILSLVQPAMPSNKPTIGKKRQLLVPQGSNKRRSVQVGFLTTLVALHARSRLKCKPQLLELHAWA